MRSLLKRLLERTPYRIVRATARNRFSAQQETLAGLAHRGNRPGRIVFVRSNSALSEDKSWA